MDLHAPTLVFKQGNAMNKERLEDGNVLCMAGN